MIRRLIWFCPLWLIIAAPSSEAAIHTQAVGYRQDRTLMRARAHAALDVLRQHPLTDPSRLGAIVNESGPVLGVSGSMM